MRYALLLCGEPRDFQRCWKANEEFVRRGRDFDVFFHAWFDPGLAGQEWRSRFNGDPGGPIRPDTAEALVETLQPVRHSIEPPRQFPAGEYTVGGRADHPLVSGIQSHLCSLQAAAALKRAHERERGFEYDVVLKMRFDNVCWSRLELPDDPGQALWQAHYHTPVQTGDQIYAGSSAVMDRFTSAFDHLPELYRDTRGIAGGLCVHHALRRWIDVLGLEVRMLPYFKFGISRNGNVWDQSL